MVTPAVLGLALQTSFSSLAASSLALGEYVAEVHESNSMEASSQGATRGQSQQRDKSGRTRNSFDWPKVVYSGNAASIQMPVQVGLTTYLPRVRFAFQYDRQLFKAHWAHAGFAVVLDRGNFQNFGLGTCGLEPVLGACRKGTVAGFDLWLGYAYKHYLQKLPWLVPIGRASIGGGYWRYPKIGGARQQSRENSGVISLRVGGGIRAFLLAELGIGMDLNFAMGATIHQDRAVNQPKERNQNFALSMEILPLVAEYRF